MATEVDEALYDSLEAGDPDAVRRALAAGADPDGEHYNESPLTFLCRHAARGDTFVATEGANPGDPVACLAALLESAASPNIVRNPGVTTDHDGFFPPLYFAAQQTRFPELVSLLLEANADVNIAMIHIEGESYTFHGATPLHQAVYSGSIRTVKALLAAGAAVDVRRGPKRQTELHEAASCGRRGYPIGGWRPNGGGPIAGPLRPDFLRETVDMIKALLAAGADVNARDSEGKTPLAASIDENEMAGADISCVYSALLRAGATLPPYVPDDEGDEEDPYLHKVRRAGGFPQYETQVTKSLAAIFEPKFPKLPAEVIPTIVAFWAHVGDY